MPEPAGIIKISGVDPLRKKIFVITIVLLLSVLIVYFIPTGPEGGPSGRKQSGGAARLATPAPVEPVRPLINPGGGTICERIKPPEGYERLKAGEGTFAQYLQDLPLKPDGAKVHYYNGEVKSRDVHEAVADLDIGTRDLQQCADAVIRLRAEYLYAQRQYEKISFNFTNGFKADYSKWMQGYRITVSGNQAGWVKTAGYSDDYKDFRKYLDVVFAYAGTLSLSKQLKPVALEEMQIGDVFIKGGSPGHCAIVVDMAENSATGEKLFLLAQSYMPAQDIHILKNPRDGALNPWYSLNFGDELITPEWVFKKTELKRFE